MNTCLQVNQKKKACVAIIIASAVKKRVNRKRWVKPWLLKRNIYTHLNLLHEIHSTEEEDHYANYYRMNDACFNHLLERVTPHLLKQDTCMRKSITPKEKLAATLRFLATGRTIECLKFSVIMSPAAIGEIIIDTCRAIVHVLQHCIKMPTTEDEWKAVAEEFGNRYHFWNCLGALDGKHVGIKKPAHSGSLYYNYKGFHSIVLMALVNAKKEFIMIDIGTNGRISDGGVLFYTKFWELYQQKKLNLPEPSILPGSARISPYVIISDEAFALGQNLMKPFPQNSLNEERKVFNYRLSRARSVVECAFGILNSKFGIFQRDLAFEPSKAALITATCCYLHNYLLQYASKSYLSSHKKKESKHTNTFVDMECTHNRNPPRDAKSIRENLCQYFCNEGKIVTNETGK
ncbi:uncharacterized protein LOC106139680 [Amyelois transitella]|uniref:uncharacterized protein LOC106139680 n=1 Tax=Amyelois transitella TaxID=680683 RepID=UPI0029905272|nr:uncharacterized protein LOC106139680 [Amyelois transitella]